MLLDNLVDPLWSFHPADYNFIQWLGYIKIRSMLTNAMLITLQDIAFDIIWLVYGIFIHE